MKLSAYSAQFLTFLLILTLTACANIPSHLIVAPDNIATPAINHNNKQAKLDVIDMRTSNHVVQILRKSEAATLLSTQERLEDTIKNSLSKHWSKQSLIIQDYATNTLNIAIEKAVISVSQETMEYTVKTEIVLRVTVNNGVETLTSTFSNNGNSDGPLQADIAVLERNFNQRLAKLLQKILANEKISHFLK